jgi:hypothetical protein
MAFLDSGCSVSAVCPPGHPLRLIAGVESTYRYRALNPAGSLKAAIRAARPDLIIPCDDGAAWQLHELHATDANLRPVIERSLGAGEAYSTLQSRRLVLQAAAELGIRVPRTHAMQTAQDLRNPDLHWPAVLKLDGTWGGEGVAIVHDPSEGMRKFGSLLKGGGGGRAWKRFLINRHPLALWLWRREKAPVISIQAFIPGRQATSMFACWQGEVLASVTVEVLAATGPTGAATIVRLLRHEEIEQAERLLARRFMLSGMHGLDFVLEEGTDAAYMIEMNPRATQLGHLNLFPQGSLAHALAAKAMKDTALPTGSRRIHGDTIVLFPMAWKTNPANPLLTEAFHDVPWEQPALVRELVLDPWPERLLLSRIFNSIWKRKASKSSQSGAPGDQPPHAT